MSDEEDASPDGPTSASTGSQNEREQPKRDSGETAHS